MAANDVRPSVLHGARFQRTGPIQVLLLVLHCGMRSFGATYYVAKTGDDAHTCLQAQTVNTPKLTIGAALSCVGSGRTVGAGHSVIVKGGTYGELFTHRIPGGTSWNAPFTLAASPGEVVTLKPSSVDTRIITLADVQYLVIEGLRMDASETPFEAIKFDCLYDANVNRLPGTCSNFVRLKNLEIFGTFNSAIYLTSESDNNELLGLKIHDCGLRSVDQYYFTNAIKIAGNGNLVEGCELHDCSYGGVEVYNQFVRPNQNIVRNNIVRNLTAPRDMGTRTDHIGISIYNGSGNQVYNNVVFNVEGTGIYIAADDTLVYNNTVVAMTGPVAEGISVKAGSGSTQIRNNILWRIGLRPVRNQGGAALDHNLCTDSSACETTVSPLFIDEAARDFRLSPGSPAIDMGISLNQVTIDLLGVRRPQGVRPDLGAYEHVASSDDLDAGSPRQYRVDTRGCGCRSSPSLQAVLVIALGVLRTRRSLTRRRWSQRELRGRV